MGEGFSELRALAAARSAPPEPMAPYLEKVRERAVTVTDADVHALKNAGIGEDEIFEHTVAEAMAEGLRRLDAAERVLG
jgi:hypothetical protein